MNVFALACLATIYTMMVLLPYNFLTYLLDPSRRRPKVLHQSVQPAQSNFALKEGQTLIGVMDTTKVMCFYIDHERREDKPYDEVKRREELYTALGHFYNLTKLPDRETGMLLVWWSSSRQHRSYSFQVIPSTLFMLAIGSGHG